MKIEQLHQLFLQSKGIATDTRVIKPGQIFFALNGDNFNGNKFVAQALQKGAGYAVLDEPEYQLDDRCILVNNVLTTLQSLARYHRSYLGIPILAITGSNGKTTSKELIHAILSKKFAAVSTAGNLNNHIGVPLTLLSMNKATEFGIVEMGANHPNEIAFLCRIALPDFGYITNFGKAHLEGFGSLEGVIKAKSELYSFLKDEEKFIFLNEDDPVQQEHKDYPNTFSFGTQKSADVQVEYRNNNLTAEVVVDDVLYESSLNGTFNAINMAAAISIGLYFKIPSLSIQKAVSSYNPQNNRSQLVKLADTTLIMDAYNANPTSMAAALTSFSNFPTQKKAVILGDMFEIGENEFQEHQAIADLARSLKFNKIFLVGSKFSKTTSSGAGVKKFESIIDLQKELEKTDLSQTYVLVKGSRGMALERVLEVLNGKKRAS